MNIRYPIYEGVYRILTFNSSLRVSRKIFIGNGSVTRTGGATYSLSAGNDMCSRGQRYLCGKPEMF